MTFSVEPNDLEAFGKQLHRAAEDVEHAQAYVKKSCEMLSMDVGPVSTIAQLWDGGHTDVVARVQKSMKALQRILAASSAEILKSAQHYQSTDFEQSKKMDATYPASKREL